ncbi:MAG: hypothetical protein ACE3JQ_03570 [Paenisporosarcina sp.]
MDFKKNFELGYQVVDFSANNAETLVRIKNSYSVPSSTVTSTITGIAGTLFEQKRWGLVFTDLVEIQSEINANVNIELDRYEIDIEEFDEEDFLNHLMHQATFKIWESDYFTVLKKMSVI